MNCKWTFESAKVKFSSSSVSKSNSQAMIQWFDVGFRFIDDWQFIVGMAMCGDSGDMTWLIACIHLIAFSLKGAHCPLNAFLLLKSVQISTKMTHIPMDCGVDRSIP